MADNAQLNMRHGEVVFLAAYLQQLVAWDARACVRIQQRGAVAGFFGAPPTGCISFIALPLSSEGDAEAQVEDRTVVAGRLRDILGDVTVSPRGFAGRQLKMPDPVAGPLELLDLPPTADWELTADGVAADLTPSLDAATAEFRKRVPVGQGIDEASAQRVANEIWSGQGWGGVPIRLLQTARLLGFLTNEEAAVQAAQIDGWDRLATGAGQVFSRTDSGNLTLELSALR